MASEGGGGGIPIPIGPIRIHRPPAIRQQHEARQQIRSAVQRYAEGGGDPTAEVHFGQALLGTVGQILQGAPLQIRGDTGVGIRIGELPPPSGPFPVTTAYPGLRYGFGPRPTPPFPSPAATPGINPAAPPPPPSPAPQAPPPSGVPAGGFDFWGFLNRFLEAAAQTAPGILDWFRRGQSGGGGLVLPVTIYDPGLTPTPGPGMTSLSVIPLGGQSMTTDWGQLARGAIGALQSVASGFGFGGPGSPGYMPGGSIVGIVPTTVPTGSPMAISPMSPWRATPSGRAVAQLFMQQNPTSGRLEFWRPAGRPLIFSRDLANNRMLERIGRRFAPRGRRSSGYRRRRRRLGG